jgi:hypothetical protein
MSTLLQHDFILLQNKTEKHDVKALFMRSNLASIQFAHRPY